MREIEVSVSNKIEFPKKIQFLLQLVNYPEPEKGATFADFEKYLGFRYPRADVRELLKSLVRNNILNFKESIFGFNRYVFDRKRFRDYIDDLEITEAFHGYFSKYHVCTW